MTHAFSGDRRVPLRPWQTTPFYTGSAYVRPDRRRSPPQRTVDLLPPPYGPPRPTMAAVTVCFAERRGVTVDELRGASRVVVLAHLRQALWWELARTTTLSLTRIGLYFGRDHSTVSHGIRAHAKRVAEGRS